MYILKNAYLSIVRGKGRNILIGIIITAITIGACIALSINKSADSLIQSYKNNNPIEISFSLDPISLKDAADEEKEAFTALDIEAIKKYGDSDLVSDYYYTSEVSLSSDDIKAVNYSELEMPDDVPEKENDRPGDENRQMNMGDFRLTGYSDPSYIDDFIKGTKKIKTGEMFTKDSTDNVIVISEDLASENSLEVGSKISLYSPNNEDLKIEFTVIGIYEDNSDINENGFMGMNAMNSRNQMYTNITSVTNIINEVGLEETSGKRMMSNTGLTAKYYLNNNEDLEKFENEVREKGLSDYYQIVTNEEEALSTLKPIQNLSSFSFTFLIVILIVGGIILAIINMINIRERKYEIGVLRAIGMSKKKVTLQLITEIFMVSIASLIIGTGIGVVLSQPVTNAMLKNEISSYQEERNQISENFGGENFERPGFNRGNDIMRNDMSNVNYVDSLKVNTDFITILQLFLVSLFLTVISGLVSVAFVNKYEPNKILQNRN